MAKIPVWIDCDTGVDDAVALLAAHRLETLEIIGLSTVAGNVALDKTTRNTLAVCDLAGADYPVHPGAAKPWLQAYADASAFHGADGLGGAVLPAPERSAEKSPMWDALFDAAQRHPGTLTLVATGPLTNVAVAMRADPRIIRSLRRFSHALRSWAALPSAAIARPARNTTFLPIRTRRRPCSAPACLS